MIYKERFLVQGFWKIWVSFSRANEDQDPSIWEFPTSGSLTGPENHRALVIRTTKAWTPNFVELCRLRKILKLWW